MNKRQQWEQIKSTNPDLAEFIVELSQAFGKLAGVDLSPSDEGWIRPELEYKPCTTNRLRK